MTEIILGDLVDKYFPFDTYNVGQREAIISALESILIGNKHTIIEAPTGIGKSIIAYVIGKVLYELKKYRLTITTGTNGLLAQYANDFSDLVDIKSKVHYSCPVLTGPYMSLGCRQTLGRNACNKNARCPYLIRRNEWSKSGFRVTNTSFHIEAHGEIIEFDDVRADVVIIDECHELPQKLIDHNTIKLTDNLWGSFVKYDNVSVTRIIELIDDIGLKGTVSAFKITSDEVEHIKGVMARIAETLNNLDGITKDSSSSEYEKTNADLALEEGKTILNYLNILTGADDGEWIITEYEYAKRLFIKPVYARQVAEYGMFKKANQFIHMSATVCGFDGYRSNLGISNSYLDIKVNNPIPKENRKVLFFNRLKVSGDYDKIMLGKIIDLIISRHGDENGIIHSVSFKLADEIIANSKYKDRMIKSNDRNDIVEFLSDHNSGKIIVSPSIYTGYDFKGDAARWAILPKVPYPYLGDPFVKLNLTRDQHWYGRETILKMVQSCGRIVRGVNDYGTNYIIDSNFLKLLQTSGYIFPEWFLESVTVVK